MDNSGYTKKVLTHKSGPFVFSARCEEFDKLVRPRLVQARVLFQTVGELPVLPVLAANLETEVVIRAIFGTAAIEGNPLTEGEVESLVKSPDRTPPQTRRRADTEILNLKKAYEALEKLPRGEAFVLSEEWIREIHAMVTAGLESEENIPGVYRNTAVKVGDAAHGGVYRPPKAYVDIVSLMGHFIDWMNSEAMRGEDPAVRAALAHYHFALIHPFGDGNGRTARLIEAAILRSGGIRFIPVMLSNFYYKNIHDYFTVFSTTRKAAHHSVTPFLTFFLDGLIASLNELRERITFYIRLFSLRDYYRYLRTEKQLTQRQHDFLALLLDEIDTFTFADLFTKPKYRMLYRGVTERTARRDIKRLLEMELIQGVGHKQYDLNFHKLG